MKAVALFDFAQENANKSPCRETCYTSVLQAWAGLAGGTVYREGGNRPSSGGVHAFAARHGRGLESSHERYVQAEDANPGLGSLPNLTSMGSEAKTTTQADRFLYRPVVLTVLSSHKHLDLYNKGRLATPTNPEGQSFSKVHGGSLVDGVEGTLEPWTELQPRHRSSLPEERMVGRYVQDTSRSTPSR